MKKHLRYKDTLQVCVQAVELFIIGEALLPLSCHLLRTNQRRSRTMDFLDEETGDLCHDYFFSLKKANTNLTIINMFVLCNPGKLPFILNYDFHTADFCLVKRYFPDQTTKSNRSPIIPESL